MINLKRNLKKGFTIIELVIVITVIAILAAILIPTFSGIVNKAQQSAAYQECRIALTTYIADSDTYGAKEGMVFVHGKHKYAYVYLDGELRFAGNFNDLSHIECNLSLSQGINNEDINGWITIPEGEEGSRFNLGFDGETAEPVTLQNQEAIYFYSFTSDDKTYVGYFVMDINAPNDSEYENRIDNCAYTTVGRGKADSNLTVSKVS